MLRPWGCILIFILAGCTDEAAAPVPEGPIVEVRDDAPASTGGCGCREFTATLNGYAHKEAEAIHAALPSGMRMEFTGMSFQMFLCDEFHANGTVLPAAGFAWGLIHLADSNFASSAVLGVVVTDAWMAGWFDAQGIPVYDVGNIGIDVSSPSDRLTATFSGEDSSIVADYPTAPLREIERSPFQHSAQIVVIKDRVVMDELTIAFTWDAFIEGHPGTFTVEGNLPMVPGDPGTEASEAGYIEYADAMELRWDGQPLTCPP